MKITAFLLGFCLFAYASDKAVADAVDPPSRVARMAYAEGSVSFQPAGTDDWVAAPLNRPLTTGDTLWADQHSRAELQLDGSTLRLASSTEISFVNLGDEVTQIQLSGGSLLLRVRRLDDNETYEIDTPNLAFSVLRPGTYRVSIDASGNGTLIAVRDGQGEATGSGSAFSLYPGDSVAFSGTDELAAYPQGDASARDDLDTWAADRDRRWDRSESARHVSRDVVGYEDLDEHGSWRSTPTYGDVWFPRGVQPSWAPYHDGHWSYIEPWGYTWVDDQPWGFAPFHYGRWIYADGAWGWVPSPPQTQGAAYARPVYAPALVAWAGVGAGVAWFALGPREVYVPSYPVSANYARNVNVSNTNVSTTVVNNVYNTTVVNNTVVNNVTYVNRTAPGAITATTTQAFSSAQPVAKNAVKVDQQAMASAQVRRAPPAVAPTKQAVLGATRAAAAKPPQAVQTRAVVARATPPPPPPNFERRQEAIKNNGGKPLTVAQVRQIQPAAGAARPAAIRVAPPAKPVAVAKAPPPGAKTPPPIKGAPPAATPPAAAPPPAASPPPPAKSAAAAPPAPAREPPPAAKPPQPTPPPKEPPPAARPAASPAAAPALHPRELPAAAPAPSPAAANSALEREHAQQQQQLQAQQAQERQRLQQQQEADHERVAKAQADAARTAELERQHAQQTQQMQQAHLQAQQQLAAKQEEQKQAAAKAGEKRKPPP